MAAKGCMRAKNPIPFPSRQKPRIRRTRRHVKWPHAPRRPRQIPVVASVTVAYNPDAELLLQQVSALAGQVGHAIVVDNGSDSGVASLLDGAGSGGLVPRILTFAGNFGVAHGFNQGIAEARRLGAELVLLLDHDSVPEPGMVAALVAAMAEAGRRAKGPVAAVGPRVSDPRDHRELPFITLGWLRNRHGRCPAEGGILACDFLISSGTLVDVRAWDAVGPYDERLFVDSVDLEWCCRARARGFQLYGACDAILDHRLGDARHTALPGVDVVVHSPERLYYMTRNRVMLYARRYVPLKWKLKDVLRALAKFATLVALVPPRVEYARMSWLGVRDAFARRAGKRGSAD
jgi:rhamnosyltransferase